MNKKETGFSLSSLVQLKSGGPRLSVRSIAGDEVTVEWFEGEKLRQHTFLIAQLKPAEENKLSDLELGRRIAFALQKAARQVPGFEKIDANNNDALIKRILDNDPTRQL